jgi:hypothetical protein
MENLAFSLSSHAASGSCDPLPQLICFSHENDFGPIPSKASKPWEVARAKAVSASGEQPRHTQPPVSSAGVLAAKSRPVDVSLYAVPAPPILLRQKVRRKFASTKPSVKIDMVALASSSKTRPASATGASARPAAAVRPSSAHVVSNSHVSPLIQQFRQIKLPTRMWPPATSLKMSERSVPQRKPGATALRHAQPWDDSLLRSAATGKENSKPLTGTTIFRENTRVAGGKGDAALRRASVPSVPGAALFHVVRQGQQLSTTSTDPHINLDAVLGATRHEQYMTQQQQLLVQQQGCLLEQQQALLNQLRQEQQKQQEATDAQFQQQLHLQQQMQQHQQLQQLQQMQQHQHQEQQVQQRAVQQQQQQLLELAEAQNCDARDLSSRLQLHWLQKLITQQQAQESQQLAAFASSHSDASASSVHAQAAHAKIAPVRRHLNDSKSHINASAQEHLVAPLVGAAKTSLSRCAEGAMASELEHHVQRLLDDLLLEAAADVSLSYVSAANARAHAWKMQQELQELEALEDARDNLRERHLARCLLTLFAREFHSTTCCRFLRNEEPVSLPCEPVADELLPHDIVCDVPQHAYAAVQR